MAFHEKDNLDHRGSTHQAKSLSPLLELFWKHEARWFFSMRIKLAAIVEEA